SEDITERVQAQQELEKERNLLNTVFDVIPHAIFVKDKDLRYLKVNRVFQEIWGVKEKDILGKTFDAVMVEPSLEKAERKRREKQVVETNQPYHQYELEITDHQGRKFIRNSYRVPLTDAQGACVGVVAISEDITERVQAQRRVQILERMEAIGQVVGGVCHNINNINQIISGNLHLLAKDLSGDNSKIFRRIHSAIDRASILLDQLLNYTQQRLVDDSAVIALNDLIKSFLEKPGVDFPANIRLECEIQEGLWPFVADRDGFPQALQALVENACQAMPEGGVVRIETRNQGFALRDECPDPEMEPGDYVVLTVADAGHGMPPEVAQKAFEPFFTTGDLAIRSGLGLTRVYGMVKHAGGHTLIDSGEGRGTTVQIFLPKSNG
ncbi:MAG: PAS domain-containing protein, partial [SAR324 cluster bacterium]|nr:PAS domain-containing protein [SAR324 cluster bacterium]